MACKAQMACVQSADGNYWQGQILPIQEVERHAAQASVLKILACYSALKVHLVLDDMCGKLQSQCPEVLLSH